MTDKDSSTRGDHPHQLLAVYVDDSASDQDRSLVEAHLAACRTCRDDVAHAARARSALRALPALDPPQMIEALASDLGLHAQTGPERAPVTPLAARIGGSEGGRANRLRGTRPARWRAAWSAGLAAAAIVAGILVYAGLRGGGLGGDDLTAAGAPAEGGRAALEQARQNDFTAASVDALARDLAEGIRETDAAEGTSAPAMAPEGSPATSPLPGPEDAQDGASCLLAAGGVSSVEASVVHFEEGTFEGRPALIGAFLRSGPDPQLVALAVDPDGCQPLHVATVPL
jgi:anti-sigma factor RsiW